MSEPLNAYPLWLQSLLQGPHALALDARCVETHISWVVLAGEQMYGGVEDGVKGGRMTGEERANVHEI